MTREQDVPRAPIGCLIVGGGPAALAPLVAASREGRLDELLARGLAVVEQGGTIGPGRIGDYAIWSDSTADSFLTAVKDHLDARLTGLWQSDLCARLREIGPGPIRLDDAARLQLAVGEVLQDAIRQSGSWIVSRHRAIDVTRTGGGWRTRLRCLASGATSEIVSRSVVLGTGGYQPRSQLTEERIAGSPLLPRYNGKVIQSDAILQSGGLEVVLSSLVRRHRPKIAIVGGSTSAVAVADLLVRKVPERWQDGAITILHRRPLRIFFPSAAEARMASYTDFGPDDICPVTGFVYRLAGLRQHSRDLLVNVLGIGGGVSETRVVLHRLRDGEEEAAHRVLDEADLIVAALGYRPCALPVFEADGSPLPLLAEEKNGRLVDETCRVLTRDGRPLDGLFGIGLAAGFKVGGAMGGEPSFVGQANGLWLWQNNIGLQIAQKVLERAAGRTRPACLRQMPDFGDAAVAAAKTSASSALPL